MSDFITFSQQKG